MQSSIKRSTGYLQYWNITWTGRFNFVDVVRFRRKIWPTAMVLDRWYIYAIINTSDNITTRLYASLFFDQRFQIFACFLNPSLFTDSIHALCKRRPAIVEIRWSLKRIPNWNLQNIYEEQNFGALFKKTLLRYCDPSDQQMVNSNMELALGWGSAVEVLISGREMFLPLTQRDLILKICFRFFWGK